METFLWLAGGFCLFVLIKYIYDKHLLDQNLQERGGIKGKYKLLIDELSDGQPTFKELDNGLEMSIKSESILLNYSFLQGFDVLIIDLVITSPYGVVEHKWEFKEKDYTQKAMSVPIIKFIEKTINNWIKNGGNKVTDYLLLSGNRDLIDNLPSDESELYNDILSSADDEFKPIIKAFFLENNISLIKFSLNLAFFKNADFRIRSITSEEENKAVAPSLIKLAQTSKLKIRHYPSWFYSCFPDVILWATVENGKNIKDILEDTDENTFNSNNEIRAVLQRFIQKYLNEGNTLECAITYHSS